MKCEYIINSMILSIVSVRIVSHLLIVDYRRAIYVFDKKCKQMNICPGLVSIFVY